MLVCFGILNNQGRRFRLFPWHFSVCMAKARNKADHKRLFLPQGSLPEYAAKKEEYCMHPEESSTVSLECIRPP
jgi:hypothetical protein